MAMNDSIKSEPLWQDRDVKFDSTNKELAVRDGENIIETFDNIEDTKGNAGDIGRLAVTNLRLIWQSKAKPRINLSVGLSCIITISNRTLQSKLRGKYDAIHIMSKVAGTRYEFIFTLFNEEGMPIDISRPEGSALSTILGKVCKAYTDTKLYRDLKLRSAIMNPGKGVKTLPGEQIYNRINGVWNLSSDQGNLGTMHVTSVRIVWHANMNELFNLSLPFIQIKGIKVRESKFGKALVIESSETSGGYVLGFRIDPSERLTQVHNELVNLYNIHASKPSMGVEHALNLEDYVSTNLGNKGHLNFLSTDENEFVDENNDGNKQDQLAAYMAQESDSSIKKDNEVIFSPELGLAIEKMRDGFTLDSLWCVIPSDKTV